MNDSSAPTRPAVPPIGAPPTVFTVGHSNLELPAFLALLAKHQIDAVVDVRSSPFSKYVPQFNRDVLEIALRKANVRYVPMGKELGARRGEPECYIDAKARYDLIAKAPLFQAGLERVRKGAEKFRLAMMCAEKDPLTCHRTILVCRHLKPELDIRHILEDSSLETAEEAETRLLDLLGLPAGDLFQSKADFIEQAYEKQGEKIAYVERGVEEQAGIQAVESLG